jgi:hypothetical protein
VASNGLTAPPRVVALPVINGFVISSSRGQIVLLGVGIGQLHRDGAPRICERSPIGNASAGVLLVAVKET